MNPVETYIAALRDIRFSGEAVAETSYYHALWNLLDEVGRHLKPKVHCVPTPKNRGAGQPDCSLFTEEQLQKKARDPLPNTVPSRGVVEVKGTAGDAWITADGEQVTRYWGKYRQVLVTNLRDFVLVGQDAEGRPSKMETFSLAGSEEEFLSATWHPRTLAETKGERFLEYLKRVLLHAAPLATPKDVAWFLASYAREAKARIEIHPTDALASVRNALEEALGLKFEGEKGERFFRSTLVQTLFYGVFSAWVLWCKKNPPRDTKARFNWHETAWLLRVPMIKALFDQVATPQKLREFDLVEVLDWTSAALDRVDRTAFFEQFVETQAVQYFYEPFLEAFDPELRKDLGVWYTPTEIVRYMVARVDTVLREELDRPEGLASPDVYVLDPCCGTGAYLVEVLRTIEQTLKAKGEDALRGEELKRAAMDRVFGFEILPAPFVVSHLQLGLLLQSLGAPLSEKKSERVGVFLTNALTGWGLREEQSLKNWPELDDERRGSGRVKRETPILVVLGNPPYNAFAGISPIEEEGLVEEYKGVYSVPARNTKGHFVLDATGRQVMRKRFQLSDSKAHGGWSVKKYNLDELYVRFFRIAERRIAEKTGKGVACFISSFSYLSNPSFVIMRQHLLSEFDRAWIDSLNGDSRETGKLTPDGKPDPSVFSTDQNREGIRLGTAIALLVRKEKGGIDRRMRVGFRDFWGEKKREELISSLHRADFDASYREVAPSAATRFSFRPSKTRREYQSWPSVVDLAAWAPLPGLLEKRRGALISTDKGVLDRRMKAYYDAAVPWESVRTLVGGLGEDAARFDAKRARERAVASGSFDPASLRPLVVMPMDVRWCYYTTLRPIWNEPRPRYTRQCWPGNPAVVVRRKRDANPEGMSFNFVNTMGADQLIHKHAYFVPLSVRPESTRTDGAADHQTLLLLPDPSTDAASIPNMSAAAATYFRRLRINGSQKSSDPARQLWLHVLAVGYSADYLSENSDELGGDWPRVPMPDRGAQLRESAVLGEQVAALLDTESEVQGVTTGGKMRSEMRVIGVVWTVGGGQIARDKGDLELTAGWGHEGKGGITMPAKGKLLQRDYTKEERSAIEDGGKALGLPSKDAFALLGGSTCDVYLNEVAYWKNVPLRVWEYTIGGYQVIKKWLSYREKKLLGRGLKPEEARHVMNVARRIAALLLLGPALDENYRKVKSSTFDWGTLAKG